MQVAYGRLLRSILAARMKTQSIRNVYFTARINLIYIYIYTCTDFLSRYYIPGVPRSTGIRRTRCTSQRIVIDYIVITVTEHGGNRLQEQLRFQAPAVRECLADDFIDSVWFYILPFGVWLRAISRFPKARMIQWMALDRSHAGVIFNLFKSPKLSFQFSIKFDLLEFCFFLFSIWFDLWNHFS